MVLQYGGISMKLIRKYVIFIMRLVCYFTYELSKAIIDILDPSPPLPFPNTQDKTDSILGVFNFVEKIGSLLKY